MTQKHFIIIARSINTQLREARSSKPALMEARHNGIMAVARGLADEFVVINPNFNRQRFLLACVENTDVDPE